MYAGFKVNDPSLEPLWQYCETNGLPVLHAYGDDLHPPGSAGVHACPGSSNRLRLKYPGVKFILAHLGHPWEGECVVTIRKHPNVFADISALHYRPFQLYQSLMLVQEYGVWEKLLFGSDYPFTTVNASIDGIRGS
jgi:predicted TIM-barrel fold metal-dependent hydrolase